MVALSKRSLLALKICSVPDRTELIDEVRAEGFVLPLEGRFRGEEEVGVVGSC
jgi:hypothetical protein